MQTSYFSNIEKIDNPLSISGKAPDWYVGPQFKVLAPKYEFFKEYKNGRIGKDKYKSEFYRLVLDPLDPEVIYTRLIDQYGDTVTLCCYEKPGDFCHRRIVAEWFEQTLGILVPEMPLHKSSKLLQF
jgi:hypothetical protein